MTWNVPVVFTPLAVVGPKATVTCWPSPAVPRQCAVVSRTGCRDDATSTPEQYGMSKDPSRAPTDEWLSPSARPPTIAPADRTVPPSDKATATTAAVRRPRLRSTRRTIQPPEHRTSANSPPRQPGEPSGRPSPGLRREGPLACEPPFPADELELAARAGVGVDPADVAEFDVPARAAQGAEEVRHLAVEDGEELDRATLGAARQPVARRRRGRAVDPIGCVHRSRLLARGLPTIGSESGGGGERQWSHPAVPLVPERRAGGLRFSIRS